jgi:hypothetical protein
MLVRSLLAIVLLIAFLSYPCLYAAWKATQNIFARPKVLPANPEDLPAEINEAFLPYVEILEQLDFQFAGYHHIYAGQVDDPPSWGLLFNDSKSLTYACLVAPHPFHQIRLIGCDFITTLEDDRKVHTTSFKDYGIVKGYSREVKQHLFNAPVKELWAAHQNLLRDVSGNPVPLTPAAFLDSMALYNTEKIRFGVERGSYHWKEPNNTYSYSLRSGIRLTIKVILDRKNIISRYRPNQKEQSKVRFNRKFNHS